MTHMTSTSCPMSEQQLAANASRRNVPNHAVLRRSARRFQLAVIALLLSAAGSAAPASAATSLATQSAGTSTSQSNGIVYLTSTSGGHTARIGFRNGWGGSIVEVSLDGTNFVNAHDAGRGIQPAIYDGAGQYTNFNCAPCTGTWSWNPTLGGDKYNHGSTVLATTLTTSTAYLKTRPLEWNPDDKGGGASSPVPSDVYVEQTASVVPGSPLAFRVHWKLTHFGTDQHYNTTQELPSFNVNSQYGRLSYYGGTLPWTGASPMRINTVPAAPGTALLYNSERWAAFANSADNGLTLFVPAQYPFFTAMSVPGSGGSGPTADAYYYLHPFTPLTLGPGAVVEGDIYLVPGNTTTARSTIYALHKSLVTPDSLPPFGNFETPSNGATISGTSVPLGGWAIDDSGIAGVQVLMDGVVIYTPAMNVSRPDVVAAYPNVAPEYCGWSFNLDSTRFKNGMHTITVRITDLANNVAILPPVKVNVSN